MRIFHSHWTRLARIVLAVACGSFAGCAGEMSHSVASASPQATDQPWQAVRVGKFGISCKSWEVPDKLGPPSYRLVDIAKNGVPALSLAALNLVGRIERYSSSPYLRFAILPPQKPSDNTVNGTTKARLVIFDAKPGTWPGPCINAAPGYWVMNPGRTTNVYYQPGENPFKTFAGTWGPAPGPWSHGQADVLPG